MLGQGFQGESDSIMESRIAIDPSVHVLAALLLHCLQRAESVALGVLFGHDDSIKHVNARHDTSLQLPALQVVVNRDLGHES